MELSYILAITQKDEITKGKKWSWSALVHLVSACQSGQIRFHSQRKQ